jgi:lipoprotein-anchoring transpeptidase ErfK/SrfK
MLTRRHFIITSATLFSGALGLPAGAQDRVDFDTTVERPDPDPFANNPWGLHPRFMPTRVQHRDGLTPATSMSMRWRSTSTRSAMTAARCATAWRSGVRTFTNRACSPSDARQEWPSWRPTDNMIEREPSVTRNSPTACRAGPENPLGARALYLYEGNRDTFLRIHGTPQPWSIGTSASSGCVRMVNAHIMDMYERRGTGRDGASLSARLTPTGPDIGAVFAPRSGNPYALVSGQGAHETCPQGVSRGSFARRRPNFSCFSMGAASTPC